MRSSQNSYIGYFDHDADMGIIGRGSSIEEAFINAAYAMFDIMTDISLIPSKQVITIQFEEPDFELALVTWLNLLLAKARAEGIILSKFSLQFKNNTWYGMAWGDDWQDNMMRGTEVKGATLTMLEVSHNELWQAKCVVDV